MSTKTPPKRAWFEIVIVHILNVNIVIQADMNASTLTQQCSLNICMMTVVFYSFVIRTLRSQSTNL